MIRRIVLVIVLSVSFVMISGLQEAFAASTSPVTLAAIATNNASDQPQATFHRGDTLLLSAALYNHLGAQELDTVHPSVYNGRYCLLNTSEAIIVGSGVGTVWINYAGTIARNAPLGTYKYYFTLKQSGYIDEVRHITFTVVH